jgi:hypothetical protein
MVFPLFASRFLGWDPLPKRNLLGLVALEIGLQVFNHLEAFHHDPPAIFRLKDHQTGK